MTTIELHLFYSGDQTWEEDSFTKKPSFGNRLNLSLYGTYKDSEWRGNMHTLLHITSNYVAHNVTLEKDMDIV